MGSFQRARSEAQRAERRRVILDTAAEMLAQMPVAALSLNELSRRVGLAKSNVLRYFESREAVLLELLNTAIQRWQAALAEALPLAITAESPEARADQLAAALADSLGERPVLCDLLSAQAAVLERNVSVEVALRHKRAAAELLSTLAELVREWLPELGEQGSIRLVIGSELIVGALWTHANPSDEVLRAYESDPALSVMRLEFVPTMREQLEVLLAGLLARQRNGSHGGSAGIW